MASTVIHMAVASEINKVIKHDNDLLLLGSIAPDISKHIGETKIKSHFLDSENTDIPNIYKFLVKYKSDLSDDFVLGYFIHLYTDLLWFKYFLSEICHESLITKLDGTSVKCVGNMLSIYIYNDYSNLNSKLLDEYDMDLHIFYREPPTIKNIIDEIPIDKLGLIIEKSSLIIKNSRRRKSFTFDIDEVKVFIKTSVELILSELNLLGIK